ncbi:MAG: hypothetical protein IJ410_01980 [Oscillospiraceae bacterium]|nr:hypothetical protein [Oscillospiraceae bacterium]
MVYYLTYILIGLSVIVTIYFKPALIKMATRYIAQAEGNAGKRILGYASVIFCVLISIYMIMLIIVGIMGIYIVLTR